MRIIQALRRLVRHTVQGIVRFASKYCCDTYGDVAELSDGPCRRCVGRAVAGPEVKQECFKHIMTLQECADAEKPNPAVRGRESASVPCTGVVRCENQKP